MNFKQNTNKIMAFNDNHQLLGEVDYLIKDNILTITHTEVNPSFRGQGIASKLTDQVILFVQSNNYKVIPQCSYAQYFFKLHKEYDKLLAK